MAEAGNPGAKPARPAQPLGGAEPGKPPPIASLERALEQVIDFLGRAEQTSRVRALAIEARRLRAVVGKWRSIEPPEDVREEMIARVLRLANDAEEAAAELRPRSGPKVAHAPALPGPAPVLALPAPAPSAPVAVRPAERPSAKMPAVPDLGVGFEEEPTVADEPRFPDEPAVKAVVPDLAFEPAPPLPVREAPPPAAAVPGPAAPVPRLPSLQFMPVLREQPAEEAPEAPPQPALAQPQDLLARAHEGLALAPQVAETPALAQPSWGEGPPSLQLDPYDSAPASLDAATMTFTLPTGISTMQAISVWPARRPEGLDPHLVMITDPYSKQADAYRALRRKLAAGTARTIAVTSARPREGKTMCAVNLALALAEACPKNVLVVEANIRSPGLAATLKFEPPVCFTEQLRTHRKESEEPWVVVEQGAEGSERTEGGGRPSLQGGAVHLLAVDPRSERPPMLDAVAFPKGMESLKRAGYEYVIIDTPAVLGAMDMQIIGDAVDGVIFTSIAKRSTRASLRRAIEQIKPAPVLGVIVLEG